ncbi:MAG: protein TolR [Rickettsiaceae bacterium]|jgi:biopolymer transport protein TolR|nr:protein TolR [Rickettsiaceae bacterium]
MGASIKHKNSRKRRSSMSEINITPFVDVLLVLLIIFMVATPMMTGSVDLELPRGVNSASQQQDEPVAVSIKSDGTIYLQNNLTKLGFLSSGLMTVTSGNINSKIFVRADTKIDYGRVMEVVKAINSAGFSQVVLVTDLSGV